jgi:hypothetical protein
MQKAQISDLAHRIAASLQSDNEHSKLALTIEIAQFGWDELRNKYALTEDDYGTGRVVAGSGNVPRITIGKISLSCSSLSSDNACIRIELLGESLTRSYEKVPLKFYTAPEIIDSTLLQCVSDALRTLSRVPAACLQVSMLLRSLHIIKPEDPQHDLSFSEPNIPFSVFLSVPPQRVINDSLRIAESILHETMHLKLTLIERLVPLVRISKAKYYSPWRGEYRSAGGILHAMYVFKTIDQFLASYEPSVASEREHIEKRRRQISEQMAVVNNFKTCPDLTCYGQELVHYLTQI